MRNPWLLIAGVVALALVAGVGQRLLAGEGCADPPELFGAPPPGYRYEPETREQLGPGEAAYVARAGDKSAFLISVSVPEPEAQNLDAYIGLAQKTDIVNKAEIDGREVVRLAPEQGGRAVAAFKSCHFIQVGSRDPAVAEDVARAVFGD